MTEPKIADKDIICYKVIRKNMSSIYHDDFKWEFGKMYYSWIEVVDEIDYSNAIYQAFHSYETLEGLKLSYFRTTIPCLTVKCTIPKGSKIYKGRHGDIEGYASNQLIINEVIDTKELYPDFDWDNYPYKEGQVIQVSDGKEWTDYQIMNIQLRRENSPRLDLSVRVDLLVENCNSTLDTDYIVTQFVKGTWLTDTEVRLKDNKEK